MTVAGFVDIRGFLDRLFSEAYNPFAVLVELALIAVVVNWCVGTLQGARGTRPLKGLLILLLVITVIVRVLAAQLDWTRLQLLYKYFVMVLAIIPLVALQPELRRAFMRAGGLTLKTRGAPASKLIAALVKSAGFLSRNKYGALVAIQRSVDLGGWAANGTLIGADVSANLLNTIFFPNSALHDLGVVIQGNKVLAANCQFPQAESDEVEAALGSRHLAAVAMSYETDALVMVVSEETGTISLADNGQLTRYLSLDDLEEQLEARLGVSKAGRRSSSQRRLHAAWRWIRRVLVVLPVTVVLWYLADQASLIDAPGVAVELRLKSLENLSVVVAGTDPPRTTAGFTATFTGTTRAVEDLRNEAGETDLTLEWYVKDYEPRSEPYQVQVEQVIADLVAERGLTVDAVVPPNLSIAVQELVTVTLPIRQDAGAVEVSEVQFEPAEAVVTLRRDEFATIRDAQPFVRARLEPQLQGVRPDETIVRERVPLDDRVGGVRAVRMTPDTVKVTLKVVGKRIERRLTGIVVRLEASPQTMNRYDVVVRDEKEWLIDITVAGDRSVVESLDPGSIQAFVPVSADDVPTPEMRSWDVTIKQPASIEVVSPSPVVHFRLVNKNPIPQ